MTTCLSERIFIRVWYNNLFRVLFILLGGNLLLTGPLIIHFMGDEAGNIFAIQYLIMFSIALTFNDYTNLNKIGRDTQGNKLP